MAPHDIAPHHTESSNNAGGIDLAHEHLVTLAQAAKLPELRVGRGGHPVHVAALYRWSSTGKGGVVLETAKLPGTTLTSREAVHRFVRALSDCPKPHRPPTPAIAPARSARRRRAVDSAERELAADGL